MKLMMVWRMMLLISDAGPGPCPPPSRRRSPCCFIHEGRADAHALAGECGSVTNSRDLKAQEPGWWKEEEISVVGGTRK